MNDTALITGSTSGIGKAFADRLAKEGYHLILVARNEEKLKLQSECLFQTYHIPVHIVTCNLENPHAAEHVFQKVEEANLSVQLLVNNAGFNEYGCFLDTDSEKEFGMMQLHMVFTTQMMKLFLPGMIDNGYGRILNIGSTGSYIPCPYDAVYAATKCIAKTSGEFLEQENAYGVELARYNLIRTCRTCIVDRQWGASAPARSPLTLLALSFLEVSIKMGILSNVSKPSIPGIITSSTTS